MGQHNGPVPSVHSACNARKIWPTPAWLLTLVSWFSFKMSVLFPPLITLCLSSATSSSSSKTGSLAGSAILEEGARAGLCRACSNHHAVPFTQLSFPFPHFYSSGLLSSKSNLKNGSRQEGPEAGRSSTSVEILSVPPSCLFMHDLVPGPLLSLVFFDHIKVRDEGCLRAG